MDSKAVAKNRTQIQFSYYDSTLPARLADDIQRSSFSTRPKYLNALLEKVLALPMRTPASSHIDELFAWIELFDSLPTERIRQLAPTQNRNFDQMLKHLLEIALNYYPEDAQLSGVAKDVPKDVPASRVGIHQLGASDRHQWADMNQRSPSINDVSS